MPLHTELPNLQELKTDIEILIEIYSRGKSNDENLKYFTNETLHRTLLTIMKLINENEGD